jgi:hypothetical protein
LWLRLQAWGTLTIGYTSTFKRLKRGFLLYFRWPSFSQNGTKIINGFLKKRLHDYVALNLIG